jgi:hypothetical protein
MDVDKILDGLLQTAFSLFAGIFRTAYEFIKNPGLFANPTHIATSNMPGPITFYVVSLVFLIAAQFLVKAILEKTLETQISGEDEIIVGTSREHFTEGLLKLDHKVLFLAAAPSVGILAAYAGFVYAMFRLIGSNVSYRAVFSIGCYYMGTVALITSVALGAYLIVLPRVISRMKEEIDNAAIALRVSQYWWILALMLPFLAVIVKATYSYFVVLSILTSRSLWITIGAWWVATIGLFVVVLIIGVWYWPIIDKLFLGESEQNGVGNGDSHS